MRTLRALVVVVLGLALLAAACGSGGESKAEIQAKVKANWEKFFNPSVATSQKVALIQNAKDPKVKAAIDAGINNPQVKTIRANVKTVTPKGDTAAVKYDLVSVQTGVPVLPGADSIAIKENGTWKVSQQTFCVLIKLGGGPAC